MILQPAKIDQCEITLRVLVTMTVTRGRKSYGVCETCYAVFQVKWQDDGKVVAYLLIEITDGPYY